MASKSDRERFIAENSEYSFDEDLFTFTMINKPTVDRLRRDGDIQLPNRKVNIPKDERWNTKQLASKLMQGILNGDSIPTISKSLYSVVGNNKVAATRTARTLVTQAENHGRLDSFKNLAGQGVVQEKVWIATPDSRTRKSHLDVDSESVAINDTFSNGLEYPADPNGDPAEVYNCRCSMRTEIIGFRRADGSISYVDYDRDETMHAGQMEEEKERRRSKAKKDTKHNAEKKEQKSKKPQREVLHGDKKSYEFLKNQVEGNIAYKAVQELEKPLTDDEIIQRIGGGDMTAGSCASLSFCYVANSNMGLDVIDFRGGKSQDFFSGHRETDHLFRTSNAVVKSYVVTREAKETAVIINTLEKDKVYIMSAGKHMAVIRNTDNGAQYLELQSPTSNGWMNFKTEKRTEEETLIWRFGCRKTPDKSARMMMNEQGSYEMITGKQVRIVDVSTMKPTEEFKDLMGYINTDFHKQKKGGLGNVK